MHKRFLIRTRILTLAFILVALCIFGRLYLLQVVRGHTYAAKADAQFTDLTSPLLDRGTIYFTDKVGTEITAATLKDGFSLVINPQKITNIQETFAQISSTISIDRDQFVAKAQNTDSKRQVILQHQTGDSGDALIAKKISGVSVERDRWRFYPGKSLAAQEIGFVAFNGGDTVEGRYGLERYYNEVLERTTNDLYANFFVELFGGKHETSSGSLTQGDLITTIEPSVQGELERALVDYNTAWHPNLAGGIIMNPKTGEIYAMATSPTFDLNEFNKESDPMIYANPLVENIYEMGSIIKPLTMAAGIDTGAVTEKTTYNDVGCMTVDKKPICNYDKKARGIIPMQEILNQSLNMGAAFVANRMGTTTMRDYFRNHYKLGTETGIDLPGEIHGQTNNLDSRNTVEYDTASYGQGIALTPVATARALSTLANGGFLVTPHLVKAIRYTNGTTKTLGWGNNERVLSAETATTLSRMLTTVVDTHLANGKDKLDHYSVAAKTGTAQIADPIHGGYYTDRYLHSFFGYFPSYDAKFIIFLFAVEPKGAQYASQTLAPPFHTLTQFLINYYSVPPDR